MIGKNVTIFYDGQNFPQTLQYCYVWSLFCNDLNAMVRCKEFTPTRHDYTHIYFLVKPEDKAKYQKIIDSHAKFPCTFIEDLPDYRGKSVNDINLNFKVMGYFEPFSDIVVKKRPGRTRKNSTAE